jgi:hypothetical protein
MRNPNTVEPWTIINNKQTEYWNQYIVESGTADSLYKLGHIHAACCATDRAINYLDKYIVAGEIKQLFNDKYYL